MICVLMLDFGEDLALGNKMVGQFISWNIWGYTNKNNVLGKVTIDRLVLISHLLGKLFYW